MGQSASHKGVTAEDPRNGLPIEHFRPRPVDRAAIVAALAPYVLKKGAAELQRQVDAAASRIANAPHRPDPPLSQPLEAVADPLYGLGVHPDIIEDMWKLDDTLPQRCRWVFWGRPALVHPQTGVVFAVGVGTLGFALRLPPNVLETADPDWASLSAGRRPARPVDIGGMGPEWRFIRPRAPKQAWTREAYDFASTESL
jgi:hypothetical protein